MMGRKQHNSFWKGTSVLYEKSFYENCTFIASGAKYITVDTKCCLYKMNLLAQGTGQEKKWQLLIFKLSWRKTIFSFYLNLSQTDTSVKTKKQKNRKIK